MQQKLTIWVLTERGLTGTENQCLGVAEALSAEIPCDIITKRLRLRWPQCLWSPYLPFGEHLGMVSADSDPLTTPFPDILIAAGRKAVGPARAIRQASQGRSFICILQHPRVNLNDFDLVAMPVHDWKNGTFSALTAPSTPDRLFLTHGAPNRITPTLLAAAREKWKRELSALPAPRLAVLIGGNSKTHRLGTGQMEDIIARLRKRQKTTGGGLMITVSRRTPKDLVEKLKDAFKDRNTALIYTGTGENPYHGFLAWADYILSTNDSTSMLSDAATTGQPIDMIPLPGGSKRHDRFMAHLTSCGIGVDDRAYPPFHDAQDVALKILELLEQRKKKDLP